MSINIERGGMKTRNFFILFLFIITFFSVSSCSDEQNAKTLYKASIALFNQGKAMQAFDTQKEIINKFPNTKTTAKIFEDWKKEISFGLTVYKLDNGTYPTTEEGISELIKRRKYVQFPKIAYKKYQYFNYRKIDDDNYELTLK